MTLGLENEKPVGYVGHMGLGKTAWNFYKCRKMEHVQFDGHMCVCVDICTQAGVCSEAQGILYSGRTNALVFW